MVRLDLGSVSHDDLIVGEGGRRASLEINRFAVIGLLLAAASVLALDSAALWVLPLLAVVVNGLALRQINRESPPLPGRMAALAGLALALILAVSAPLVAWSRERANRSQALETANAWFTALRQNEPAIAHQWTLPRWMRVPEGEPLSDKYATSNGQQALARFVDRAAVATMLKLGKRAHVRYAGNETSNSDDETRTFVDRYSVTVDEDSRPTSFVLALTVKSRLDRLRKTWSWEVADVDFVADPGGGVKVQYPRD